MVPAIEYEFGFGCVAHLVIHTIIKARIMNISDGSIFTPVKVFIFSIALFACENKPVEKVISANNQSKVQGHYQLYSKSPECETVKSEFDFDSTGHFLYHSFCLPYNWDPTGEKSLVKPYSIFGSWHYLNDSSLIELTAFDGRIVKLRFNNNKVAEYIDQNDTLLFPHLFFIKK